MAKGGMHLERFVPSSAGFREILRGDAVRSDLQRRADNVEAVLSQSYSPHHNIRKTFADSYVGSSRAGATAGAEGPAVMAIEAKRRIIGGAIDAAGG